MKKLSKLFAVCLLLLFIPLAVFADAGSVPSLLSEYWTENSKAAESLNSYLLAVTDPASPDYIPVADRVAVFDLDGTLMCETCPFCFEYMVFADYALNSGSENITDEVKAVAEEIMNAAGGAKPSGMSTRQASAGAIAYKGLTMRELSEIVSAFKESEATGFSGLKRGDAYYKPMVELFNKLLENHFTLYIVTATERNIVREVIRGTLDIPPSHVIGTEYGYTVTAQGETADADYTFQPEDRVVFDGNYFGENAKTSKVDAIVREIGQQPVLAFGNSSGDLAMEIYTISNNPYKSAAYMVVADDEAREYGNAESAEGKKQDYENMGITVISMRDDFATIYGDGVEKTEILPAAKPADEAAAVPEAANPADEAAAVPKAANPADEAAAIPESANPADEAAAVPEAANPADNTTDESSPAAETAGTSQGPTEIQYIVYLGTNDKDTARPVMTQSESLEKARNILIQFFGGFTIQEAQGGWIDDNGTVFQEYTLVIYLSDTTLEQVHEASKALIEAFNQSSVLIQANPTTTEFYSGD